jgi:hypothetical protein
MKASDVDINLVDSYYTLLKSLSPNNKLELIERLSKSLKTTKLKKDTSWESLFGSWELDQSTDTFIEELKKDRKFSRKPIDL